MVKVVYEDDCLAPGRYITIEYNGQDPFKAFQSSFNLFRSLLEIDPADYWERDFRWDTSEDPRGFYARMYVNKGMDKNTKIVFEIIMSGSQPSDPKKPGKLLIQIGAKISTQYSLNTPFQQSSLYRSLLYLYNFFFYFRIRRSYIYTCQQLIYKLRDAYKSLLKIE